MPAHELLAVQGHGPGLLGILEDCVQRLGAFGDGVDEVAGLAVLDLVDDPAHAARDHGPALPEPLGDGEPESLLDRLLDEGG